MTDIDKDGWDAHWDAMSAEHRMEVRERAAYLAIRELVGGIVEMAPIMKAQAAAIGRDAAPGMSLVLGFLSGALNAENTPRLMFEKLAARDPKDMHPVDLMQMTMDLALLPEVGDDT